MRPIRYVDQPLDDRADDSFPLYDPADVRDACGVGFVSARNGTASHHIVRLGLECLHNLDHRGAKAADGTGDGAGVMTRIPYELIERELRAAGMGEVPRLAIGVVKNLAGTYVPSSVGGTDLTIAFALIVLVLMVRPTGIFGRPQQRRV